MRRTSNRQCRWHSEEEVCAKQGARGADTAPEALPAGHARPSAQDQRQHSLPRWPGHHTFLWPQGDTAHCAPGLPQGFKAVTAQSVKHCQVLLLLCRFAHLDMLLKLSFYFNYQLSHRLLSVPAAWASHEPTMCLKGNSQVVELPRDNDTAGGCMPRGNKLSTWAHDHRRARMQRVHSMCWWAWSSTGVACLAATTPPTPHGRRPGTASRRSRSRRTAPLLSRSTRARRQSSRSSNGRTGGSTSAGLPFQGSHGMCVHQWSCVWLVRMYRHEVPSRLPWTCPVLVDCHSDCERCHKLQSETEMVVCGSSGCSSFDAEDLVPLTATLKAGSAAKSATSAAARKGLGPRDTAIKESPCASPVEQPPGQTPSQASSKGSSGTDAAHAKGAGEAPVKPVPRSIRRPHLDSAKLQWFCGNDSRVERVRWDAVAACEAYILMYVRVR